MSFQLYTTTNEVNQNSFPIDIDMDAGELDQHKNNWKLIQKHLNDLKGDISFDY